MVGNPCLVFIFHIGTCGQEPCQKEDWCPAKQESAAVISLEVTSIVHAVKQADC